MKKHTHHHQHRHQKHVQQPHKKHPLGNYFVLLIVIVSLFTLYAVWKDEINTLTGKVAYGFGLGTLTGDATIGELNQLCRADGKCDGNLQCENSICVAAADGLIENVLKQAGEQCQRNDECTTGICRGGLIGSQFEKPFTCQQAAGGPDNACDDNADCGVTADRGCVSGRCMATPIPPLPAPAGAPPAVGCVDTDNGNPLVPGTITILNPRAPRNVVQKDTCRVRAGVKTGDINEYQCVPNTERGYDNNFIPCPQGTTCELNVDGIAVCQGAGGVAPAVPALAELSPAPPIPVPLVAQPQAQPATAYKAMLGQSFLPVSIVAYLREHRVEHAVPTCKGCSIVEFSCDANGLIKKSFSACGGDKTCADGVCSAEPPKACASDNDCVSNIPPQKSCVNGFCQAQGFRSQPCKPDSTCQAGLVCYNNECVTPDVPPPGAVQLPEVVKKDAGQPCNLHSDCKTNYCNIQTFVCSVKSVGSDCEKNEECGSGVCQDGRRCVNAEGGACQSNNDCVSGACQNNVCLAAPAGGFGQPCDPAVAGSCVAPLICNPASRMCAQPEGPVPVAEAPAPAAVPVPLAPATGGACENVSVRQKIGDALHECIDATGGASPELKLFRWRILLKQPCKNSDQCIPGAMCENSQCVGVAGTLCGSDNTLCAAGLVCDAATQKCALAPEAAVPPIEAEPVAPADLICTGIDENAEDLSLKGRVTVRTPQGQDIRTEEEYCVDEQGNRKDTSGFVMELFCLPPAERTKEDTYRRGVRKCPDGTGCRDGACVAVVPALKQMAAPCQKNNECAAGLVCRGGSDQIGHPELFTCQLVGGSFEGVGVACDENADCIQQSGHVCLNGACLVPPGAAPDLGAPEAPVCIDSNKLMDYIKQWRADKKRDECKGGAAGCVDSNKLMDYIKQWRADKKRDECKK